MIKIIQIQLDEHSVPGEKFVGAYPIFQNITNRLRSIKSLDFRKWTLVLTNGTAEQSTITWEWGKELIMSLCMDINSIVNCTDLDNVKKLYRMTFEALGHLFKTNGWDVNALNEMHRSIQEEQYKASLIVGKDYLSPDKQYKAQLYCELFPDYANLFVQFVATGGKEITKIFYLKLNDVNPDAFFLSFTNYYWKDAVHFIISNSTKEVFYVFNLEKGAYSIEYRPLQNSQAVLQEYADAFQYGVPYEDKVKIIRTVERF